MATLLSIARKEEWIKFLPSSGIELLARVRSPLPSQHETHYTDYRYDGFQLNVGNDYFYVIYDTDHFEIQSNATIQFTGNVHVPFSIAKGHGSGETTIDVTSLYNGAQFVTNSTRLIADREYFRKIDAGDSDYDYEETSNSNLSVPNGIYGAFRVYYTAL